MGAVPALRPDLGVLPGYHSAQVEVEVRLNTNESPLPPPPGFVAALAEAVAALPLHRYPDRSCSALRADLARLHDVQPDQVFLANGSNEVLQCLLLAYGGPGRSAATFEPTYAMHATIARMTGTAVARGERADDLTLALDEVRRVLAASSPEVTFLCSPNNPTGGAEPKDVVEEVLAIAPGLVVVDEAYAQFASWSALGLVGDDMPLVVTRTYSKTWSMAGVRLGYLIGPPVVVAALWEKAALPYHVDALKQVAGRLALRFTDEMEDRVALLVAERERVAAGLARLPVDTWPSDANFLLFRPRHRGGAEVWSALVERSVLVRDCSSWPRLEGCLRVTIGTPAENDAFLAALEVSL
ncbi:MAG TPA: histidinol-phosphate transaminase [Acidimicrobiales bacterium]|nr:histidinol-phosphate transaminase [Acidimicrobiales bacterium]